MARLTESEKQEVIRWLEADKPLPEKFRWLLFDDKREVELVWNGKTNEVCNTVLPFQVIEQVDEPRVESVSRDARAERGTAAQPTELSADENADNIAAAGAAVRAPLARRG